MRIIKTANQLNTDSRILIIDEDQGMRQKLSELLQQEGHRVVAVSNAEQGLEVFGCLRPNLILVDTTMPEIDGYSFCQQFQSRLGGDCPPVLMIINLEDEALVEQEFEAGAVDFVTKPVHWPVLRHQIRRVLREAQLARLLAQSNQELQQANQELYRLAVSDSLTQLANRRRFEEYLQQQWQCLSREQAPLALILGDVDCFKAYNDTYGHQAGDQCLQRVAKALSWAANRPADLVARYGGEEFAVILPNTPTQGAVQVAKKIQHNLSTFGIPHACSPVSDFVTVSLGVASLIPSSCTTPAVLVRASDQALYQAKDEGRNCVVIAAELPQDLLLYPIS